MFRRVPRPDRIIYWPTAFVLAFASLYYLVRAMGAMYGVYGPTIFQFVPLEVATTICSDATLIVTLCGLILASNVQARRDAEKLALFDPLTNLPNRRYFRERLTAIERTAGVSGRRFGLIHLKMNSLNAVNEQFGRAAGDDLLLRVSRSMAGTLRECDCVARLEGEEFIVIAESIQNRSELLEIAKRVKEAMESHAIQSNASFTFQAHCGCALFPDDGRTAETVMRVAYDQMHVHNSRPEAAAFSLVV